MILKKKALENILRKVENAGNQHFLLFPKCFLLLLRKKKIFIATFSLSSATAFTLVQSKILSFGGELDQNKPFSSDKFKTPPKLKAFPDNRLKVAKLRL